MELNSALLYGAQNVMENKDYAKYCEIGDCHYNLGNFKSALRFHEQYLEAAKKAGNKADEGRAQGSLGMDYRSLGNLTKAKECYEQQLRIAEELEDKAEEGRASLSLGSTYAPGTNLQKLELYNASALEIAKEVGDPVMEGSANRNLGKIHSSLKRWKDALTHFSRYQSIAKESKDRAAEASAYGDLASVYLAQGNLKQAIECQNQTLCIAQEQGDEAEQGNAYYQLGCSYESLGSLDDALRCYECSLKQFDAIRARDRQQSKDEWKINLRNEYQLVNIALWEILIKQSKTDQALLAAEKGRAEALIELLKSKYRISAKQEFAVEMLSSLPPNTVFMAVGRKEIYFWVLLQGNAVHFDKKYLNKDAVKYLDLLKEEAYQQIDVRSPVECEDRSLDAIRDKKSSTDHPPKSSQSPCGDKYAALRKLYDQIIRPIAHVLRERNIIIVPDGPLCLAPFAAFFNSDSEKFLFESYRIRVAPSLSCLKMITHHSAACHGKKDALLVGNPSVEDIIVGGKKLISLPCAEKEVQAIGKILKTKPLTRESATKEEVLSRLNAVALVHIAAHGCMETGEIYLTPNPDRPFKEPEKEDYLLTMADVASAQLQAQLVVLSCCHSGRGKVNAEGVVGIARSFLGAGARSVLVSLWAINDKAAMEFMMSFYQHLVEGKSASEALNKAREHLRLSEDFCGEKHWAPFVLIGDDVHLKW